METRKVQAVDQNGRWENGETIDEFENGDKLIKFDGWEANYNHRVPHELVGSRLPLESGKFLFSMSCL